MPTWQDYYGPSPYDALMQQRGSPVAPAAPIPGFQQRGMIGGIEKGLYSPNQPIGQQPQPAPPLNPHLGGQGGPGPMPFGAPSAPPRPGAQPSGGGFGIGSNALMQGGLALMGGGGAQGVAQGFASGGQVDARDRQEREKKAQQARAKEALKKAFPSMAEALDGFDDPSDALRYVQGQQSNALAERRLKAEEGKVDVRQGGDGMLYRVKPDGSVEPTGYGGTRAKTNEQTQAERLENLKRANIDPNSPQGRHYYLTGDLPKDVQRQFTSGDRDFVRRTETATVGLQSGIGELEKAYKLASPVKGKDGKETYAIEGGQGAFGLEGLTTGIRDRTGILADPKTAKTVEFNRILRSAAIQQVLSQFKGATTDTELQQAIGIVGDANNSVDARMAALRRVLGAMYDQRDGNLDQIEEAYKLGGQEPGALYKNLASKRNRVFGGEASGADPAGIR